MIGSALYLGLIPIFLHPLLKQGYAHAITCVCIGYDKAVVLYYKSCNKSKRNSRISFVKTRRTRFLTTAVLFFRVPQRNIKNSAPLRFTPFDAVVKKTSLHLRQHRQMIRNAAAVAALVVDMAVAQHFQVFGKNVVDPVLRNDLIVKGIEGARRTV